MHYDSVNKLKEKKMFKDLEQSAFLPNLFFILIILAALWAGSYYLGRYISKCLLNSVSDENLKPSYRSIITCGFQIFIFFIWIRVIEGRKFSTVGFYKDKKFYKFFKGFFIGIISITIITIILFISDAVHIEMNKNINLNGKAIASIVIILLGWLVQSAFEEIAIRGWLIPVLGARYNVIVAIFIASISFGILHIFVTSATIVSFLNLTLSGVFFALYVISEDCLWGVWGCHFGWNLALGNIYAFSVSGSSVRELAIFKIKAVGNNILTGGSFGPEGGILATVAVVIGIIIYIFKIKRRVSYKKIS